MVTCSELATIVATDNNSFLVWGSRPLIKSPLCHILSMRKGTESDSESAQSSSSPAQRDSDSESAIPDACSSPDSGCRDVGVNSPESKSSLSAESVNKQVRRSSEGINKSSPKSSVLMSERRQSSIDLGLMSIPNIQIACAHSHEYLTMLNTAMSESAKTHSSTVRQSSENISSPVMSRLKKGSSGNIQETVTDGVILQPTAIDLVNKSGILTSLLEQGLRNVKLEGIASFGPNLIVLLHAHFPRASQPAIDLPRRMVIGPRLR